ncbi:hypothetical protein CAPTEDRAFT_192635 [Capitella teleta]|uniref:Uncharacterized protein n=1 Tax=Capitella teleta TaxID=283909 RepID=R7T3V7_CAPTE|nr:hypothetical protein CAPTEDRAFT_192635 [Capitella teleta]|eukprot:ELT87376.1 hypothetical protein CAPTEDRAFT_192635 [Capitella teleta]
MPKLASFGWNKDKSSSNRTQLFHILPHNRSTQFSMAHFFLHNESVSRFTSFATTQVDGEKAMKAWVRGTSDHQGGRQQRATSKRLAAEAVHATEDNLSDY